MHAYERVCLWSSSTSEELLITASIASRTLIAVMSHRQPTVCGGVSLRHVPLPRS